MHGVGGKAGWSWIFIMEGILTLICGLASFFMIHDWPDRARFLTPLEREFVQLRLKQDTGLAQAGKFSWKTAFKGMFNWKAIAFSLCYIGCAEPIYSQS